MHHLLTNKFDYQMGGKIAPDVCPKHKTRGNMWTQGTPAVYDCKKMKEQLLCDTVKNCTAMEEGSKIAKLCGWCPGDSKPKVKNLCMNAVIKIKKLKLPGLKSLRIYLGMTKNLKEIIYAVRKHSK